MCLLYENSLRESNKKVLLKEENNKKNSYNEEDQHLVDEIKLKLFKRIQFLKHFLKNTKLNKFSLFKRIILQLQLQKNQEKNMDTFFNESLIYNNSKNNKKNKSKLNLLSKIQTLFLYSFYLEENSIINYITNPSRLFSNLYFQFDIPTQVRIFFAILCIQFFDFNLNLIFKSSTLKHIIYLIALEKLRLIIVII